MSRARSAIGAGILAGVAAFSVGEGLGHLTAEPVIQPAAPVNGCKDILGQLITANITEVTALSGDCKNFKKIFTYDRATSQYVVLSPEDFGQQVPPTIDAARDDRIDSRAIHWAIDSAAVAALLGAVGYEILKGRKDHKEPKAAIMVGDFDD